MPRGVGAVGSAVGSCVVVAWAAAAGLAAGPMQCPCSLGPALYSRVLSGLSGPLRGAQGPGRSSTNKCRLKPRVARGCNPPKGKRAIARGARGCLLVPNLRAVEFEPCGSSAASIIFRWVAHDVASARCHSSLTEFVSSDVVPLPLFLWAPSCLKQDGEEECEDDRGTMWEP